MPQGELGQRHPRLAKAGSVVISTTNGDGRRNPSSVSWWHWFFFARPEIPERVIMADPDGWYHGDPEAMGQENYDEWRNATRNPDVVRAMIEDYRAGLTVDRQHKEADRYAGNRLRSPLLVLWSKRDDLEDLYADRSRSGETGPTTYAATASTLRTTWPRKHPTQLLLRWATSSLGTDWREFGGLVSDADSSN
jgi:hypothetical protein